MQEMQRPRQKGAADFCAQALFPEPAITRLAYFRAWEIQSTEKFQLPITRKHPHLAGSGDGHSRADPYLIALALSIKSGVDNGSLPVIVTEENRGSDIKIPKTADKCGVESSGTVGMFERGGWAF